MITLPWENKVHFPNIYTGKPGGSSSQIMILRVKDHNTYLDYLIKNTDLLCKILWGFPDKVCYFVFRLWMAETLICQWEHWRLFGK